MISLQPQTFSEFRDLARRLLAADLTPERVSWEASGQSLFEETIPAGDIKALSVPKEYLELAELISLYRDPVKWTLLYRVLYRLLHGERSLLRIDIDDDVRELRLMEKALRRDMHKMTAFVRFRKVDDHFIAWHKPDHLIVERMAPWFRNRFGNMRWSILTPDRSAHWDLDTLTYGPGVPRSDAPDGDALEELWKDYYRSIFNPARVKIKAMKAEMPVRHWATLPEAQIIPELLLKADARVLKMSKEQKGSAAEFVPLAAGLDELQSAARQCKGCSLYEHATQVVFGEGPLHANVVMVGEQPGDEEDTKGHPFVGPAGRLLDKAMLEAGLDRSQIYVTNAVKHFKFEERGKRRIHAKPTGVEVSACRPWLEAELLVIKPKLVVCLGATAAQSLMGRDFRITSERARFFPHRWANELVATIHPSAILRTPPERYDEEYGLLVRDLGIIAARVRELEKAS
jgi:DNA polymerase